MTPDELSTIAQTLAPIIEERIASHVDLLRAEVNQQLEIIAMAVVEMQVAGGDVDAANVAYRTFVVSEAKRMLKEGRAGG